MAAVHTNVHVLTSFRFLIKLGEVLTLSLCFFLCDTSKFPPAAAEPQEDDNSPFLMLVGDVEDEEEAALLVEEVSWSSSTPASLQNR